MSFWQGLLNSAINAAAQGAVVSTSQNVDLKTVGVASGASAIAGVLSYILAHPLGQHPAVAQAVTAVTQPK